MKNNTESRIELMKYPVLVFSIVIALIILKLSLGLEFGMITELSTDGLKFSEKSNKATLESITELETKLNDSVVRIAALEKEINKNEKIGQSTQSKAFSASQIVSDATATIANLRPKIEGKDIAKVIGYIWIGNFENKWGKTTLAKLDTGQPISLSPMQMQIGTEYKVLGNMVVRDGLPPNNAEYYRARKSLGVVPRGSIISILKKPEKVDREFAIQYWVEVEYTL